MINQTHKKHIRLLIFTLGGCLVVLGSNVLWNFQLLKLPAPVIHYLRIANFSLNQNQHSAAQLNVLFHRQEHSLSCEAAVLKMVLNYHGLDVSESEVIEKMPFDSTSRSGDVWGDPDLGFVGNIDGKMGVDGYGVHWGPLAVTAANWKQAKIIKNGLASDLVNHISEGRPVIIWGYLGRGRPMSWSTSEGKKVYAVNGEHTYVVYGHDGPADDPKGFMLMDPIYGPIYWTKAKLLRNWDAFGRMGLVVYP